MDICFKAVWAAAHRKGPHASKWGAGIFLSSCLAWVKTGQKTTRGGNCPVPVAANKARGWFLHGCHRSEKSNVAAKAPRPSPAGHSPGSKALHRGHVGAPPTSPALTECHMLVSGGGIMARVCKEMAYVVFSPAFPGKCPAPTSQLCALPA